MIPELSLVVLMTDPPQVRLKRGDVCTVVHVHKDGVAYEVEFVDDAGRTIALITFKAADVRPIEPSDARRPRRNT